ncbi:MAG: HU family DNA-binding protein [Balneolales bacterium]
MTQKETEQKITALIAKALKQHQEVELKNLGVFSIFHRKQDHRQEKDGRVLLAPPADIITFRSD